MDTTTNKGQIYIIVVTIAFLASVCVCMICWLSGYEIKVPPELNTLTSALVGYLTGALTKTSPTQSVTSVSVQDKPTVVPADDQNKPKE